MKNRFIKTIAFMFLSCLLTQCSLTEIPHPGMAVVENTFKTEDDAYTIFNGVLSTKQQMYSDAWMSIMVGMPDMFVGWRANIATLLTKTGINTNTGQIQTVWNLEYKSIQEVNSMQEVMKTVPMDDKVRDMFNGMCHFVRGWSYLDLVRLFGRVPLKNELVSSSSNHNQPRSSIEDVYACIFNEFQLAYEKMPDRTGLKEIANRQDRTGHPRNYIETSYITKDAAAAATAIAALSYGNYLDIEDRTDDAIQYYNMALEKATLVIDHGDYKLYRGAFCDLYNYQAHKSTSDEIMFRANYLGDERGKGFIWCGIFMPNTIMPEYGKGFSQAKIMPWYVEQFSADDYIYDASLDSSDPKHCDPRFDADFLTRWYGNRSTDKAKHGKLCICFPEVGGMYPNYFTGIEENAIIDMHGAINTGFPHLGLYHDPKRFSDQDNKQSGELPLLRLGEMYLIQAEAMNELGTYSKEEIFKPLNILRERARSTVPGNVFPKDIDDTYLQRYMNSLSPVGIAESYNAAIYPETDEKYAIRRLILKERDLELCGENRRYYDIKRMQAKPKDGVKRTMYEYIFGEYIPSLPSNMFGTTFAGSVGDDGIAAWTQVRYDPRFSLVDLVDGSVISKLLNVNEVKKYNYLPIPFAEIQYNASMAGDQNYGW